MKSAPYLRQSSCAFGKKPSGGMSTPCPMTGSEMNAATLPSLSFASRSARSANPILSVSGRNGPKPSLKCGVHRNYARTFCVGAGEFYRAFVCFGSGVAEEDGGEFVVVQFYDSLREQAAEQRAVELYHVRQIHVDCVLDCLADYGVVAPHSEHAVARYEVEVFVAVGVVEVCALGAFVALVEPDCFKHGCERSVDVFFVQIVVLPEARVYQFL